MTRAPRAIDLSFLSEEEAKQILQVLERDLQLQRAEKERISKLHKKKEDATGLPGVTGEWFEEIQKRKFQKAADTGRMLKQPLAHRLRKAIGNDSTNAKPSSPQIPHAQKRGSPSILGGLRTPLASLFSFRKSKRQHSKSQQQHTPRYDCFATVAHTSSIVEKMAKTETHDSPLPAEPANKCFDASHSETMEDNTCTWNEELEKELLRVLGSLDDQLAQEQCQNAVKRRTPTDYGSRALEASHYPSASQANLLGGLQRNDRSMFLSNGKRTLRAKEYRTPFRPRVFYDTYLKGRSTEDYTSGDPYSARRPSLKRGYSAHSLGHSSAGSLQFPSGPHNSGFGRKDFMPSNTFSRSRSFSCLERHESLTASLQHSLESNRDFTEWNYCHQPRRAPLSSVVWNTPESAECLLYPDSLLRTQSLMEFDPMFQDMNPYCPQENTRYGLYRSKINFRRAVPCTPPFIFADRPTDPLYFDNWENYLSHQLERNSLKPFHRYSSFRGRVKRKSFPSGRTDEQPFWPSAHQCSSDEVLPPFDKDSKRIPANLMNWQCAHAKQHRFQQCESGAQSHLSESMSSMEHPEEVTNKLLLKHAEGIQRISGSGLSDPKCQTEYAVQRQNLLHGASQNSSNIFAKHSQAEKNFEIFASEEVRGTDQLGKMDRGDIKGGTLRRVSGQVYRNTPTISQMLPAMTSFAADPQDSVSLKPPLSLSSKMLTKPTPVKDIENTPFSSIQNRNRQKDEFDCTANSDLDHTPSPRSTTNSARTPIRQRSHQQGHQSESLRAFTARKAPVNTCSPIFGTGSDIPAKGELSDSCTKNIHSDDRFVRHATSNSISGCPSSSPPKSSVTYYRKAASIGGTVISEKPVSRPPRQFSFKNWLTGGEDSETLASDRIENSYSNQEDKSSSLILASSSLSTSSKDITSDPPPQAKDYYQDSSHATNTTVSTSEKVPVICNPDKTEISMPSECEETDAGNSLKQYKTTSTLTVNIEEDHVEYHELISVYYTLPRKRSRMLCNLFLDDNKKDLDSSPVTEKFQPSQKTYEVRVKLGTVAFPSSLEKADSSGEVAATPEQNSNTSDEGNSGSPSVLNPIVERSQASCSPSVVHNKEAAKRMPREAPALAFPDRVTSDGPLGIPKLSATGDKTTNDTLVRVHTAGCSSPLKEQSADTPLNLNSLSSANATISLCNLPVTPSTMNTKEENSLCCQPSTESTANNNPHILPSCSIGNNQERKCTTDAKISTAENVVKQQISAEVNERSCRKCHVIFIKGNGLQPRNESVRNSTDRAFISEIKVHSDSQNQTPQADAGSIVNSLNQSNKSASECGKTEQEEINPNLSLYNICRDSQRPVRTSIDNQKLSSKDDLTTTRQELPDHSATENKLNLDCTEDKASDTEKRKGRSSIKNKLAAMYKISRKFSSKKSVNTKPHVRNIFSQNEAPSLEISKSHNMLISPQIPRSFLQIGNENQNQNSQSDGFEGTVHDKADKKSQTNRTPPLHANEIRRPFTNLCNQKRDCSTSKQNGGMQNPAILFPKDTVPKLSSNSHVYDKSIENYPTFSRTENADANQKKKDGNFGEPLCFPVSSKTNSNLIKNYSKSNIHLLQNAISSTECDQHQNIKQSNRLKNPNLPCVDTVLNPSKIRERHFSETTFSQEPHKHLASGNSLIRDGGRYSRKFKSYSELLICDENENWDACDGSSKTFGSRRIVYPSVDFGIFGKEQQQAFLDNIKRSLTEGRLWRPYLLKDSSLMRKQRGYSLSTSVQLGSSFGEGNVSQEGSSPSEPADIHKDPAHYSDEDSDTTTDDEYYLNENDKESEL
ncbi:exophilin-5 [Varanus komodoensis]|uniref:exophilin-5 n=1 Tax=Varanus komodoensis TaxID=61221 RepID=UPI001CF788B9|nr:exophilin-5 [Varanus komodoensis]